MSNKSFFYTSLELNTRSSRTLSQIKRSVIFYDSIQITELLIKSVQMRKI